MFNLVTKGKKIEIVDLSLFKVRNDLDAVRPNEWFNIPAPVVDAISVLMYKLRENMDRVLLVQSDLKQTQQRINEKERRQKDSIREVLEYCKEEIGVQGEALVENIENLTGQMRRQRKKTIKKVKTVE